LVESADPDAIPADRVDVGFDDEGVETVAL
jgi:hypothetical protein